MVYKKSVLTLLLISCFNLFAETAIKTEPNATDVLNALGISHWKFEIDNPSKKSEISCKLLYYFRNEKKAWESTTISPLAVVDTTGSHKKITIGVYQKNNDITLTVNNTKSLIKSKEDYNIDLSDLGTCFHIESIDIKDEIVLRIKPKGHIISFDNKKTWDKYLALKITTK